MLLKSLIAGLAALAATAQAQEVRVPPVPLVPMAPAAPTTPPMGVPLGGLPGWPGDDVLMFISTELGGQGVVKGAPYSATAVSETRQTLADGNRIVRSTSSRLYRDAQGRTRQEQGGNVVFINDVVEGRRLLLDTGRKTAREMPAGRMAPLPPAPPAAPDAGAAPRPPAPPGPMSGEEARSWAEAMRQWAKDFSSRMRGEPAVVERDVVVRKIDGSPKAEIVNERVEVIRLHDAGRGHLPPLTAIPMLTPPGTGTTTPLGSRDFDGVRADGTRTTWTIPAGQIGNEKPIDIVSERWYAPDLMLVVLSRHADPRSGERIYRLEGIRRDEPAPELFRVPSGYELRTRSAKPERR